MNDNEIEILGTEPQPDNSGKRRTALLVGILVLIAAIVVVLILLLRQNGKQANQEATNNAQEGEIEEVATDTKATVDTFCVRYIMNSSSPADTLLRVFKPGAASVELLISKDYDTNDASVIFATQAANLKAEDGGIIGDFVYKGTTLAQGCADSTTLGFCAIVNNKVILGKANPTNYLDSTISSKGFFYRHYCYVTGNGPEVFSNSAKSYRRAICIISNKDVAVVESYGRMSMTDFAQALYDNDITLAVGLMGSKNLDEWYRTDSSRTVIYQNPYGPNPNRNYLIFRKK